MDADVIVTLVVILFAVIGYIGQALAKWRQMQEEARRRGQPAAPPPPQAAARPVQPAAPPVGQPQPRTLEEEIGQFLREAAQRRVPPQQPRRRAAAQPVREKPIEATVVAPSRPVRDTISSTHLPTLHATIEKRELRPEDDVGHLRTSIGQGAGGFASLAGESAKVEEPVEVGFPLDAEETPTMATDLAAMLGDAEDLRQAIILREILNPPVHRWR